LYKLSVTDSFSAAHRLEVYQGACSKLHGHNWKVRVALKTEELDDIGMAMDFGEIKARLRRILDELDHTYLNEVPSLGGLNPTSENLARHVFRRMAEELRDSPTIVCEVEIWESERSSVVFSND